MSHTSIFRIGILFSAHMTVGTILDIVLFSFRRKRELRLSSGTVRSSPEELPNTREGKKNQFKIALFPNPSQKREQLHKVTQRQSGRGANSPNRRLR